MSTIKNVALIGASGNLGPSILNAFLENGNFNITVISRESSKATFPSSVKVIKADFSNASLVSAFKGQDAVVSIAGAGQLSDQQKYIDAAVSAGVKRFIPSEFGSDTANPELVKLVPVFKPKVDTTDYLVSKESDSFSWTTIVNGPFFDWGLQAGFLGFNLKDHTAQIWDDGNTPFSSTNLATIGETVVRVLLPEHFEESKNKHVYIASHTITQNQILAILEKVTGQKFKIDTVESAPLHKISIERLRAGDFGTDVVYPLIQIGALGAGLGNPGDISAKLWNEKLGLPKEDLEADIKAAVGASAS